jgi:glucose/arabinose dehydrogenase
MTSQANPVRQTKKAHSILFAAAATLFAACGPQEEPVTAADDAGSADLILPPGFEAMVVFEGTGESREIYIREDGDIFVSLAGLADAPQILGLRDDDGDHVIDSVERFYHLTTPEPQRAPQVHIEYFDDYLYAVENEQLVRMHLPLGQLTPDREVEVIVKQIPYQRSHRGRTLSIDDDGWVYVNIGAPSNVCQAKSKSKGSPGLDPCPQLEQHAGIWRWRGDVLNQEREDGELFAGGIRNAIAQTWDPVYGGLYVGQMGRDRLDSLWPERYDSQQNAELPSEEFFRAEKGQNYGWPYCYYDGHQGKKVLAPEYGGDGVTIGRCSEFALPQLAFPGHYSPSSIAFYHAEQFPPKYRGGAFVALKGSWNRAPMPQDGYIVAFVPFAEGAPTGSWEVFADGFKGFATLYERGNARYRPQSVFVHPDGSLYILDNKKGRIWRVTYAGDIAGQRQATHAQLEDDRDLMVATSQGKGADLYVAQCASCHQGLGGGVPGIFPPLTDSDWVSGDKSKLIAAVLHGLEGPIEINGELYDELMPGFAYLDDEDIAALLTFVRSSFGNSAEPVHESEVLLIRNREDRDSPWDATQLMERGNFIAQ